MKKYLYNRSISLEIGSADSSSIILTGFRILFKIKKTSKTENNVCELTISNLRQETRQKIRNDQKIIVRAGYTEAHGEEVLFIGTVKNINHSAVPPTTNTTIICYDGQDSLNDTVSLSYTKGFNTYQILQDLTKRISLPASLDIDLKAMDNVEFTAGISFVGEPRFFLDTLCDASDLEWSYQNNTLLIRNKINTEVNKVIHIKPNSGLIGSPEYLLDVNSKSNRPKKKSGKETVPGWKIKSQLFASILPGSFIQCSSKAIGQNVQLKVYEISHNGDNYGTKWESTILGVPVISRSL